MLSIDLFSPSSMKPYFNLRRLNAFLALALSALLNQGPGGLVVQRLFSIVFMCFFPSASNKDLDPKSLLVPCQGQERARFSIGVLPMAWDCGLPLFHSNIAPML